jgi:hypothetical protein
MNKILILSTLISALSITACHDKDDHNHNHSSQKGIQVDDPADNGLFYLNDTVHMNIHMTAEEQMHGFDIKIINTDANDTLVYDTSAHAHGTDLHFHEYWINDVKTHSDMQLIVTVILDHDGNTLSDTTRFHCMPTVKK